MNSKTARHFIAAAGLTLVMATSLFTGPAQAAELPLLNPACGAQIEESFRLSGDRTCTGDGWHINKAEIIVDLNGFHLRGDRAGSDTGLLFEEAITLDPADDVTVRNGTIRGFETGIQIGSSVKRTKINRVALVDHVEQAIAIGGSKTTVSNSTVVGGDEDGIIVNGDATGVQLLSNRIANNVRYGIFMLGNGSTVSKNAVMSNGDAGLLINGNENVVSSNNVVGNGNGASAEPGIYALFGSNNTFTSNKIFGNGDDGFRNGEEAANNEVSNNTVRANGFYQGAGAGFGTGIDTGGVNSTTGTGNLSLGNDATVQCNKASMCKAVVGDPNLTEKTPPCGKVVVKSFRLGADMECTGTALVVGAPNITIDLAGHTIKGDGDDRGIDNENHDGVRITNGVIRRFDIGIRIAAGAVANVVDRVIAIDNGDEGIVAAGSGHSFLADTAVANGNGGFSISATTTTLERSRSANNAGSGILIGGSGAAKVKLNVVGGNTGIGISLANTANQTKVRSNVVGGNGITAGEGGIESSVLGAIVESNTVFGNGGSGYDGPGDASKINLNRFDGNGYVDGVADGAGLGLDASDSALHEGVDNLAFGNDAVGECDPASLC